MRVAGKADIDTLSTLAQVIWQATYPGIISDEQIRFMLSRGYSHDAIRLAMQRQHWYLLVGNAHAAIGFMATAVQTNGRETWVYVSKLYLLPGRQRQGLGQQMLNEASHWAQTHGMATLKLNVNRGNPAYYFYLKQGFTVEREVDIPHHGYVLNDYLMRKVL